MATILIVDDRPANRDYLLTLLGYGGHRLLEAADGAEALATARTERPDLIIADVLMPTMDGYELVRRLRADPVIAHTPVIFWTAQYHEREARALAQSCGVSSVITKPSEPEAVLKAVEAALGVPAPLPHAPGGGEFDQEHLRLLTDKLSEKADDLQRTNERLSALVELNLQLASELDLTKLLQTFAHAAREIIGARYSIAGILDADGTGFQALYTSGMDAAAVAQLSPPDPQLVVLRTILREGRCVCLRNPGGDPAALGFASSHPPIHSWLGAAITSPMRVYGYICLIDKLGGDGFNGEDERLAGILAAQVGRIYQNGSLYSEALQHASNLEREMVARVQTEKALAERAQHGLLIGELGAALTRGDSLQEMLQLTAAGLVRNLDAAFGGIWLFNQAENVLELMASAGCDTYLNKSYSRIPLGHTKIGLVAQESTPQFTNDLINDPTLSDREWVSREGMVAFAGYPLLVEDRLLGVVVVLARHPLGAATVDAVVSVANQLALGIERTRTNATLREREEHIRLLLDSTAEAVYGIDVNGFCTFANAACARLLAYSDTGLLMGRNMHSLIHHTRKDGTPYPAEECPINNPIQQNRSSHVDHELLWRADGSSFPAEYWSFPILRDGVVLGSVVTFLDITERRELEDQFRRAQQRLQDVVASSPAVLFTLAMGSNQAQGITWVSENLRDIFGYSPEDAIGLDWWMANIDPADVERFRTHTYTDLVTRGRITGEYRFRHVDGSYRWTRCDVRLMRDANGRPAEAVGAWLDITERKLAEKEQSNLWEQLQQAQKLESIGRLAGGVAHDFNNLLTVINGYGDMVLQELKPPDPMHEMVSEIRAAGQRAAELTKQLLILSRKPVLQTTEVNLNNIITEVERMLARVIGEDIRLESVLSPSLGYVLADPGQIHQVIMNLAVNARDAMPNGGTLLIETANIDLEEGYAEQHAEVKPGPYVYLKVSDSGTGMTKDVLAHLFEPFFTTKKVGEGTGLGLATVYGIVKQSAGSIWVYSEPGQGTSFHIYFPRTDTRVSTQREPERGPESLRGKETILVVEDQEALRKMTGRVLRNFGYRVLEAANPGEALLQSERYAGPIHLMLTDVIMPELTGPELAARLKPLRPSMDVVFMSGYSERAIAERLELSGQYLPKPFSPEGLGAKLRSVLGASRSAGAVLVVDDEPGVRHFLRDVLTHGGYHVLEAANGQEAARQLKAAEVGLVIMDLAMTEQEGIEATKILHGKNPHPKIIAMSGPFAGQLHSLAEQLGAHASLAKPIQPQQLLDTVARVLVGI